MTKLMKMFMLFALTSFMVVSCTKDDAVPSGPTDDPVDRPFPIDPDTEYAPQRPQPDSPNPEF